MAYMETKKTQIPEISDAELKIMNVVWKHGTQMTSAQIVEALENETDWSTPTIKTLIHRLKKKGALKSKLVSKDYYYSPTIAQTNFIKKESKSFLKKLFNGATAPMISHFVQSEDLSLKEIEEIKALLDDISKEKRKK